MLHNRSTIEEAPLQIYSSALIFTPEMSIIRKQFMEQVPMDLWVSKSPKRLEFLRADAPGPFQPGRERGLLARRQQTSVRIVPRNRPGMERGDGASRADARGPF